MGFKQRNGIIRPNLRKIIEAYVTLHVDGEEETAGEDGSGGS